MENKSTEFLIGEIYGIVKSHDETLRNIEEQTRKTNGRVTSLETTNALLAKVTSETSGYLKVVQDELKKNVYEITDTKRIVNELLKDLEKEQVSGDKAKAIESLEVEKIKVKSDTWKFVVTSFISFITAVLASVGIKISMQ